MKNIWKDSVFSKVIAEGIIAIVGPTASAVWLWLIAQSNQVSLWETIKNMNWVWYVFTGLAILFFLIRIPKAVREIRKRKRMKLLKDGFKQKSVPPNLLFKFDIEFEDEKPYVDNVTPYCCLHAPSPPIKMLLDGNYVCSVGGCPNIIYNPSFTANTPINRTINLLQSEAEAIWDDILKGKIKQLQKK